MELVLHEEINEVLVSSGVGFSFTYSLFLTIVLGEIAYMKLPFLWVKSTWLSAV